MDFSNALRATVLAGSLAMTWSSSLAGNVQGKVSDYTCDRESIMQIQKGDTIRSVTLKLLKRFQNPQEQDEIYREKDKHTLLMAERILNQNSQNFPTIYAGDKICVQHEDSNSFHLIITTKLGTYAYIINTANGTIQDN